MSDREQLIDDLFARAVELPVNERERLFARHLAGGDDGVVTEVKALLTNYRRAQSKEFLNQPFAPEPPAARAQTLLDGQEFEGYLIKQLIAEGGMGEVYLAEDQNLNRKVAIKLVKIRTSDVMRRFRGEQQILAHLQHPNIAQLFEARITSGGLPFFVMEYVEGASIDKFAHANELSLSERLNLFRTVCSAVSYAHQNLVIHRDLKPGNILVSENGVPKLLDFGIAKLLHETETEPADQTATMFRAMTPEYASPEQVRGDPVTTASDVYSLGVLLYELLTGVRPYQLKRRTPDEIAKAIREAEPPRPSAAGVREPTQVGPAAKEKRPTKVGTLNPINPKSLRGDLDNIVLKALRKETNRRYASVEQFSEDIRRHLEGLPVRARPDTVGYRTSKFLRRHKLGVAAAAMVVLVLLGGIAATAWQAHKAKLESQRAQLHFNKVRELAHSVLFDYHDAIASLPGSTPVRERLVKDALKYLDELSNDPGNSVSLQRELAAAYLKVGDVQGRPYVANLGQTDGALASYQKARAILERISQSQPTDLESRHDLATVLERIGNIKLRTGDFNQAFEENDKALKIREELLAQDQTNKVYRSEVADSYLYLGDALQAKCAGLKCQRDALEYQQRALEMKQALANDDPANFQIQRSIRQAHARIGFRFMGIAQMTADKNDLRQWLEHAQIALDISRKVAAANPTNALDRRNVADQLMATANAQFENGKTTDALAGYAESAKIFTALSASDQNNSEARRDLTFVYFRLGNAYAKLGRNPLAREAYTRALELTQQLLAQDKNNEEDLAGVIRLDMALSQLADKEGDLTRAIEIYQNAVNTWERIVSIAPQDTSHQYSLATEYHLLALLHARSGGALYKGSFITLPLPQKIDARQAEQWREARATYQKGLDIYENLRSKGLLDEAHKDSHLSFQIEIGKCDAALAKH